MNFKVKAIRIRKTNRKPFDQKIQNEKCGVSVELSEYFVGELHADQDIEFLRSIR